MMFDFDDDETEKQVKQEEAEIEPPIEQSAPPETVAGTIAKNKERMAELQTALKQAADERFIQGISGQPISKEIEVMVDEFEKLNVENGKLSESVNPNTDRREQIVETAMKNCSITNDPAIKEMAKEVFDIIEQSKPIYTDENGVDTDSLKTIVFSQTSDDIKEFFPSDETLKTFIHELVEVENNFEVAQNGTLQENISSDMQADENIASVDIAAAAQKIKEPDFDILDNFLNEVDNTSEVAQNSTLQENISSDVQADEDIASVDVAAATQKIKEPDFDILDNFLNEVDNTSEVAQNSTLQENISSDVQADEDIEVPQTTEQFVPLQIDEQTLDYTAMPANKIFLVQQKGLIDRERPSWIPEFSQIDMAYNKFMPLFEKQGDNYLIYANPDKPLRYLVTPEIFAATIDYYAKIERELNKAKAVIRNAEQLETAVRMVNSAADKNSLNAQYYQEVIDGKHEIKAKPVRIMPDTKMLHQQTEIFLSQGLDRSQSWDAYKKVREELDQKLLDMQAQLDDYKSTYTKGAEMSYGDNNTNAALLDKYGVMVKRQNGDAISGAEITELDNAFDGIKKVYGDVKDISAKYELKISHSGDKKMHARKTIGIFNSVYHAIGVSFGKKEDAPFVLAHEYAHFLDNRAGQESKHFFASDMKGTPEAKIADVFRRQMNTYHATGYWGRTCECFARAMEQYAALQLSPQRYEKYCKDDYFCNDTNFKKQVVPLVEKLMQERNELWHKSENKNTLEAETDLDMLQKEIDNKLELTPQNFAAKFIEKSKEPQFADDKIEAARVLLRETTSENRKVILDDLKVRGCVDAQSTQLYLQSLLPNEEKENKTIPKKEPDIKDSALDNVTKGAKKIFDNVKNIFIKKDNDVVSTENITSDVQDDWTNVGSVSYNDDIGVKYEPTLGDRFLESQKEFSALDTAQQAALVYAYEKAYSKDYCDACYDDNVQDNESKTEPVIVEKVVAEKKVVVENELPQEVLESQIEKEE
ncbi:MAG: hypothetical protein Ta2F_16670 [Termitinemataceae bacterium]|nr:MAG: hypothetical protein Ta2F_16670 [Termitinemataceae bacterium]